jgi:hypothetical protein
MQLTQGYAVMTLDEASTEFAIYCEEIEMADFAAKCAGTGECLRFLSLGERRSALTLNVQAVEYTALRRRLLVLNLS